MARMDDYLSGSGCQGQYLWFETDREPKHNRDVRIERCQHAEGWDLRERAGVHDVAMMGGHDETGYGAMTGKAATSS